MKESTLVASATKAITREYLDQLVTKFKDKPRLLEISIANPDKGKCGHINVVVALDMSDDVLRWEIECIEGLRKIETIVDSKVGTIEDRVKNAARFGMKLLKEKEQETERVENSLIRVKHKHKAKTTE